MELRFIRFYNTATGGDETPLPVVAGGAGITFLPPATTEHVISSTAVPSGYTKAPGNTIQAMGRPSITVRLNTMVSLMACNGRRIAGPFYIEDAADGTVTLFADDGLGIDAAALCSAVGEGGLFRIGYAHTLAVDENGDHYFGVSIRLSNALCRASNPHGDYARVEYKCNEPLGDIAFDGIRRLAVWLPLRLSAVQYKQQRETYTMLSGDTVMLYATTTAEWEGQTDYIPASWHERIVAALQADELLIDGRRMYLSSDYEIQWADTLPVNGEPHARATFKLRRATLTRNNG